MFVLNNDKLWEEFLGIYHAVVTNEEIPSIETMLRVHDMIRLSERTVLHHGICREFAELSLELLKSALIESYTVRPITFLRLGNTEMQQHEIQDKESRILVLEKRVLSNQTPRVFTIYFNHYFNINSLRDWMLAVEAVYALNVLYGMRDTLQSHPSAIQQTA